MKKIAIFLFISLLTSCNNYISISESESSDSNVESSTKISENENPKITIYLSNSKVIKCELYPAFAPISVENFLSLVENDFYDGTIFHRVIENFMIQGGGYYIEDMTIYTKDSETIKGEFSANGIENSLLHTKGVLSMARSNDYDSASSQFFICVETCSWLDGNYAAFGKVSDDESLDVAIEISKKVTTTIGYLANFPVEPISITSIEIENN